MLSHINVSLCSSVHTVLALWVFLFWLDVEATNSVEQIEPIQLFFHEHRLTPKIDDDDNCVE